MLISNRNICPEREEKIPFRLEPSSSAQLNSVSFHTFSLPEVPEDNQISSKYIRFLSLYSYKYYLLSLLLSLF